MIFPTTEEIENHLVDSIYDGAIPIQSPFGLAVRISDFVGFNYSYYFKDMHIRPMAKGAIAIFVQQHDELGRLAQGDIKGAGKSKIAFLSSYAGNSMISQASELATPLTSIERSRRIINGAAGEGVATVNDFIGRPTDHGWEMIPAGKNRWVLPTDRLREDSAKIDAAAAQRGQDAAPLLDTVVIIVITEGIGRAIRVPTSTAGTAAAVAEGAPVTEVAASSGRLREVVRFLRKEGVDDIAVRRQIIVVGILEPITSETPVALQRFRRLFPEPMSEGKQLLGRLGDVETRVMTVRETITVERAGFRPEFEVRFTSPSTGSSAWADLVAIDTTTRQPARVIQFVRAIPHKGGQMLVFDLREMAAAQIIEDALGPAFPEFIATGP
jgi:hypothetical protein